MSNRPNKLSRGYSQYQSVPLPERWPISPTLGTRSAETSGIQKDSRLINCYATKDPEDGLYWIEKRPGFTAPTPHVGGGPGLGIYNFLSTIYGVYGTKLFANGTPFANVLDNGSTYRFQQVLGSPTKLVLKNNTQGWYVSAGVLTQITDPDFPASSVPGIPYLDGTLYIMRPDGGIQGSAIDDPTSWDPVNLIIARNEPDQGVALIKHQSYIVALKQWSSQAFYNAGNPTGSPLARVDGFTPKIGCKNGNTVRNIDDIDIWVSSNRFAGCQVVKLENLQISVISTPPVDRIVTKYANASEAFTMKLGGKKFYILSLSSAGFSLVYDIDEKFWYIWTDYLGTGYWPFRDATFDSNSNVTIIQSATDTNSYNCDTDFVSSTSTDNGQLIPVDIYTDSFDFGIDRSKQLNMMYFKTDVVKGSKLQIRCSDDDFLTWSNWREVNLGSSKPMLDNCGSFDQRAINLRHRLPTSFRIKAIGLQVDIGTT